MEALGTQDPENDDSFTFFKIFIPCFWRFLEPKTPKMVTVGFYSPSPPVKRGESTVQANRGTPPALQAGRPLLSKVKVLPESGATFGKAGFDIPLRRFYLVNLP